MPAAYAHHRFGDACIETMPEKIKQICLKYRELFDFGVHGPDLLFYYKPLSSNEVNSHGQELHHWTGAQFFEICKYVYSGKQEEYSTADKNAMLAYLLGFLAHFTLDSSCHAYVNAMTAETGLSHNLIESQYEVYLMRLDGMDPMQVDRSLTLKPSAERAAVIARFFPFDTKKILKAMQGQKQVLHLFYSPKERKKKAVRKAISSFKIAGDFGDLFLDKEMPAECEAINQGLYNRQKTAVRIYPGLMQNFLRYLYDKTVPDEYFRYDFEGELHEEALKSAASVSVIEGEDA